MRVVVKFGGTSVATGDRIERAATSIEKLVKDGHEAVVVVSAMGSTTDDLFDQITFEADPQDQAEIVSMGERTSVRMLKAALTSKGLNSIFLEPQHPQWPIILDENGTVSVTETTSRSAKLGNILHDTVPVVTGFLAEDTSGNVTTLGRGGSDTTAVMLGNYLHADEVVIVTDVSGVMTGDPNAVEGAMNVGKISVDELRSLSFRGAEVIAPSALSYKTEEFGLRVLHYQHDGLLTGGTDVTGKFQNLIDMRERAVTGVTVAGRAVRNTPHILRDLSVILGDSSVNIQAVSSGLDSITFYVDNVDGKAVESTLHTAVIDIPTLSSVTAESPIAVIRISGGVVTDQTTVLRDLMLTLSEHKIHLNDLITSATSIGVFVNWNQRKDALRVVQQLFDKAD
ncbi:MAG TPA: aspartate kinase [Halobacteriales archaeon]|uniref:aspartate kinase n=1 Tax=Candidatus Hikarchaeum yamanae TaxID=2675326 RepID=UPI0017FE8D50|nr:aspartate kinase [Halobacteriales archaeon]